MPQHRNFSSKIEIFYLVNIGIGSVSADMKKSISVIYRIGRFKKWLLSVHIGIGRYEKKLIGCTLIQSTVIQIHTVNKRDPPPLVHLVVLNYARQEQTKSLARSLVYYCL